MDAEPAPRRSSTDGALRARRPGREMGEMAERGPGGRWPVPDRSVLATVLGLSPLVAVGIAAALTAVGVVADLLRTGGLGTVFTVCHLGGCVLAVAWVRRDGLFGPMVAPPLLVAVAVPVVVLTAGDPEAGAGVAERLLVIGAPLVNAFPIMAWTTGAVLAVGVARLLAQRPDRRADGHRDSPGPTPEADPDHDDGDEDAGSSASSPPADPSRDDPADAQVSRPRRGAADAARGATRRSTSPRRS